MKAIHFLPLFVFFLLTNSLIAQQSWPKQSLKFGFGSTVYGESDFQGRTRYIEYERQLFSRFSLAMEGSWGSALNSTEAKVDEQLRRLGLKAHLFFAPLRKSNNQLKLGFGLGYHQSRFEFAPTDPEIEVPLPENFSNSQRSYSAILEYEVFIIKNWTLGSRFNIQQFEDGKRSYFWGLNTGLRF